MKIDERSAHIMEIVVQMDKVAGVSEAEADAYLRWKGMILDPLASDSTDSWHTLLLI